MSQYIPEEIRYSSDEPIYSLQEASLKYKLPKSYIKKLIDEGYVRATDLRGTDIGKIVISGNDGNKLKMLSENKKYQDLIFYLNPSYFYDYCPELIDYLVFHDFVDRFCWLIKLWYAPKEVIKKRTYRIDTLFQYFIRKNKFDIKQLSKLIGKANSKDKYSFHLKKGWYNELVRSVPLKSKYLKIGTNIDEEIDNRYAIGWNIVQSYYSIYEYCNSLVFTNNSCLDTKQHNKSIQYLNNNLLNKFSNKIAPYPFNIKYPNKDKISNLRGGIDKHLKYKYARFPRDLQKDITGIERDIIKYYKHSYEGKGIISFVNLLHEFRIWANYLGIDVVTQLREGFLLSYLYRNLGMLCFFYGGISEIMAIAFLGENEVIDMLEELYNKYILENDEYKDNMYLIPVFMRFRIYKSMGLISKDIPFLIPRKDDPIIFI